MKLLIVVHHQFDLWNVPAWFTERLSQEFPHLRITQRASYDGIEEDLRDAEIMFTISLRPEQFAATRSLRWIHAPTAAVHQLLFPELVNSDVVVTNSREVHGPVVAEHVLALDLCAGEEDPAGRGIPAEAYVGPGGDLDTRERIRAKLPGQRWV